jgi:surface antigen
MKNRFTALLAFALGANFSIPPAAAIVMPYAISNLSLSKHDLALMQSAAREQMDGKPDGTAIAWQNPESGNSGSATLVKTSVVNGQTCRLIRHTILPKGESAPTSYIVNICRQSDGSWKLNP